MHTADLTNAISSTHPQANGSDAGIEDRTEAASRRLGACSPEEFFDYLIDGIVECGYHHKVDASARAWLILLRNALLLRDDRQLGQMIRTATTQYAEQCEKARRCL